MSLRVFLILSLWLIAAGMVQARQNPDLPPIDIDRVKVGMQPPDFSLKDLNGQAHSLRQYRNLKYVVLVFYRGHW
ncbi:MAG: redoxin domain-containing protein [Acidobacteria bacterium]|nr:redoxin domain-containing protein [Acidobacteriota bacterium]